MKEEVLDEVVLAAELEGKHFLFRIFGKETNGYELCTVFKVEDGELKEYWTPTPHFKNTSKMDKYKAKSECIDALRNAGITDIYTFTGDLPQKLLGLRLDPLANTKNLFAYEAFRLDGGQVDFEEKGVRVKVIKASKMSANYINNIVAYAMLNIQ